MTVVGVCVASESTGDAPTVVVVVLAAGVVVRHKAAVDVRLGERAARAEDRRAQIQRALCRRRHQCVGQLSSGVVGVISLCSV